MIWLIVTWFGMIPMLLIGYFETTCVSDAKETTQDKFYGTFRFTINPNIRMIILFSYFFVFKPNLTYVSLHSRMNFGQAGVFRNDFKVATPNPRREPS